MRWWRWLGVLCLWPVLGAWAGAAHADQPEKFPPTPTRYDMLLMPQDVERVLGFYGVRLVPKDPLIGADGTLNFALRRGRVILKLDGEDVDPKEFARKKQTLLFRNMYSFQFRGLGDDAYEGPANTANLNVLSFQKGNHWITLTAGFTHRGSKPFLSMDKLMELARVILQRL